MDSVIEVDKFRKRYGSYVTVSDLSFQVCRGEIFGLLRRIGAGKTTSGMPPRLRRANGGRVQGLDPSQAAWRGI
jgi:ABC-type uncharacterized transport system ATPase subunit